MQGYYLAFLLFNFKNFFSSFPEFLDKGLQTGALMLYEPSVRKCIQSRQLFKELLLRISGFYFVTNAVLVIVGYAKEKFLGKIIRRNIFY